MARRLHVLLVDDDVDVRESVAVALKTLGFKVDAAATGRQALKLCEGRCRYDIVLTDVVMPEIGGTQLAEMLRQQWPKLPVILMTGRDSMVDHVIEQGVVALMKPFTMQQLWRVMEEMTKDMSRGTWLRTHRASRPRKAERA